MAGRPRASTDAPGSIGAPATTRSTSALSSASSSSPIDAFEDVEAAAPVGLEDVAMHRAIRLEAERSPVAERERARLTLAHVVAHRGGVRFGGELHGHRALGHVRSLRSRASAELVTASMVRDGRGRCQRDLAPAAHERVA